MNEGHGPSFDLAAAVNNREILENCLLRSSDVAAGRLKLKVYEGYPTAGAAYNAALREATSDVLILAHQDVYLPVGFLGGARARVAELSQIDPDWAVAGVAGQDSQRVFRGQTWSSGMGTLLGQRPTAPIPVATLDEMLLFIRVSAGLIFDEAMPSFHLYAADVVMTAKARGLKSYVIDTPAIHHSRAVVALDGGYRAAYRYMQRKWRRELPIPNLVCPITRSPFPLLLRDFRLRRRHGGHPRPPEPRDDPSAIARRLGLE